MDKNLELPETGARQDLIRRLAKHYPAIDLTALELITQIKTIAKMHTAMVTNSLAKYDLTEARMYVLCNLILHERSGEEPMSPSLISERLAITRATVTSLLDGLEESGYVIREHSSMDRRAIFVHVTDKARELLDSFLKPGLPRLKNALSFLSDDECKKMNDWLAKLSSNLDQLSQQEA
jgi:DNA-binding MarR family transcriptional regulator